MKFMLIFVLCQTLMYDNALSQSVALSEGEVKRYDSIASALKDEAKRARQQSNDSIFSIRTHERNESEGLLREAKRIEREADDAAVESRAALRKEKRLQRKNERVDKRQER